MNAFRAPVLVLLLFDAAGCEDAKDPVAPLVVTRITLSNGGCATLRVGGQCQLVARALTAEGEEVPNATLVWSSDNVTRATVNFEGRVTGVNAGTVIIRVQTPNGAIEQTTTVTVSPPDTPPI